MKKLILYADKDTVRVFMDDMGTIDEITVIKADGRIYVDMDVLMNVIGWKLEDADSLMQVYTYRRL